MNMEQVLGLYNYWVVIFLMMTGFYIVIARQNFIKTIIGLNIFQISVILLYITMGKVTGGTTPIIPPHVAELYAAAHAAGHDGSQHADGEEASAVAGSPGHVSLDGTRASESQTVEYIDHFADENLRIEDIRFSNPLPSVLMLTAIVVGVATTALALALIVRIKEDYGTIEEDEVLEMDRRS